MQKRKCLILGIVLILCLSLFACTNSDDTIYSDNNTNQIEDGDSEYSETTNTSASDENSDIIGAWRPLANKSFFYIFNGDNVFYVVSVEENPYMATIEELHTCTYDIQDNICTLKDSQDNTIIGSFLFRRSGNELTLENNEHEGDTVTFELINDTSSYSLPGEWRPANNTELRFRMGSGYGYAEYLTFYNDGSFEDEDTGGQYQIIHDGNAILLNYRKTFDNEAVIPIQMLGCGMMLIGDPEDQQLLVRTSPN